MKPGKEYEIFIYEKFKEFFFEFDVSINDKILGKQSNIKREIDISIKGVIDNVSLLYIVQCKDFSNKPADIKIIGEFSAVIRDVEASKGFLICTSGFAKSNYQYAKNLGIELFTIEDVNSKKWKAEIQIPITYIYKKLEIIYSPQITVNEALAEKNKNEILISENDFKIVTLDNGKNPIKILDYLNSVIENKKINIEKIDSLILDDLNLQLMFAEVWVPVQINLNFITDKIYYFKYLLPEEYSHLINHITKEIIPLKAQFKINSDFDESYIRIDENNSPIFCPISVEIEENLYPINELKFDFKGF